MISIQEHLNKPNPDSYLQALAEEHWLKLNPQHNHSNPSEPKYTRSSLFKKIDRLITTCSGAKYLKDIADKDSNARDRHLSFFIFLKANNYEKLKKIIVAKPNELVDLRVDIMAILIESDLYSGSLHNPSQTKFGLLLTKKLFDYSGYRNTQQCIKTIENLELNNQSCPYCNIETIDVIQITESTSLKKREKALLDIDHFMPKAQNPFFALSFFNLIPTCIKCNGRIKKSKPFSPSTHVNPFDRSFNDIYKFKFNDDYTFSDAPFECKLICTSAIDKTASDLLLEKRYQKKGFEHAEIIVLKFKKYRVPYKDNPETLLDILFDKGYSKDSKDILRFDKGKLFRDLLIQIDVDKILID